MKKISLLIFHSDYQHFLNNLRELGVVHIHENRKKQAEDEHYKETLALIKRVSTRSTSMERRVTPDSKIAIHAEGMDLLHQLDDQFVRVEQIDQLIGVGERELAMFHPWGDLPREKVKTINETGWDLRFFVAPDKKYQTSWEESYNAVDVAQEKGQRYFMTVTPKGSEVEIDAEEFEFPKSSSEAISLEIKELLAERERINEYLDSVAADAVERLERYKTQLSENTDMIKINIAAEKAVDDKIIELEGWVPSQQVDETQKWLDGQEVYYQVSEPTVEDNPPIKLKNGAFASLFEFIGEMYSLPNYREIDLTPFFAPFFLLFAGLCLGDAGYGLLILVALTIYKPKAKKEMRPMLSLGQWLGGMTIAMGIVSGTFFGIPLMEVTIPWVEKLRVVMLDSQQLFDLSLILGVIQILFGMCIKVANLWKQNGLGAALSTIGWVILIIGGGATYYLSTKGMDVTYIQYGVFAIAGLLILILNDPKRNILANFGTGLWDTYGMATGLLGDLLSYIRLFALGISSSVLGLVFNDLAMQMSGDIPVLSPIIMLAILLFGHGLNIFLAALGSFVHPLRLTFVEFYKNAGFEGGGRKYTPLKRRS